MPALTAGAFELSFKSVAVTVYVPWEPGVILNCFEPATRAALAGSVACRSLEVIATVSVTELIMFQLASTAFTAILKAVSGDWADGEPVLPLAVPGAAVSPGTSTW